MMVYGSGLREEKGADEGKRRSRCHRKLKGGVHELCSDALAVRVGLVTPRALLGVFVGEHIDEAGADREGGHDDGDDPIVLNIK